MYVRMYVVGLLLQLHDFHSTVTTQFKHLISLKHGFSSISPTYDHIHAYTVDILNFAYLNQIHT